MSITGGIVLFVVVWFLLMFIVLPIRSRSQAENGNVVPGTHAGAPADFRLGKTMLIVTLLAIALWAVLATTILSGWITIEDLDWMGVLGERIPN